MTIDFYHLVGAPQCAVVLLAAKSLGVDLNIKFINYAAGDHLKPEFTKMNPQNSCPTINDDGFFLWESRPIMTYIAEKYGKDDSLYPKDPKKRAVVDQRLYFDVGTLYQRFTDYMFPQMGTPRKPANPDLLKKLHDGLEFLNTFLDGQTYVAGDSLTLGDISLVVSIATFEATRIDLDKYENIKRWFAKCKQTIPGWNIVDENVTGFKSFLPPDF